MSTYVRFMTCITAVLCAGCSETQTWLEPSNPAAADVVAYEAVAAEDGASSSGDVSTAPERSSAADVFGPSEDLVPPEEATPITPVPPLVGDLLIEEFYYSGAPPSGGADHYFSDQFIELVNASGHPLDLSGLLVADVAGSAGAINPGMLPDSYRETHSDRVVMQSVWRLPDGVVLAPQARLIVAHDGTNHQPFSTVDLSGADFEAYVDVHGRDDDHPTVQNLESLVYNGGYDWLMTVFGPSAVILEAGTSLGTVPGFFGDLPSAPATAVLDAIETLMDGASASFKRLPDSVDSGFAWVSGTYVGESLHRRQEGTSWIDTNDSGADFQVGLPSPGVLPEAQGVFGEAWIELGGGMQAFEPLSDGDTIELVAGIQGGWHVDVSLRFGGFGPDGILLSYQGLSLTGQLISFETQALLSQKSVLADSEGWQRVGDRVVLDILDPAEVVGSDVLLEVTATLDGQTWSDARTLMIVDAY